MPDSNFVFQPESIVKIASNPLELGRPCYERMLLSSIEHISHRQSKRVQIILYSQQLK
jgi:hypothetical protein